MLTRVDVRSCKVGDAEWAPLCRTTAAVAWSVSKLAWSRAAGSWCWCLILEA